MVTDLGNTSMKEGQKQGPPFGGPWAMLAMGGDYQFFWKITEKELW